MNNENRSKAKKEAGVRGEMEISVCAGNEKNTGIKSDAETSGRFGTTVSGRFSIKDCRKGMADSGKSGHKRLGRVWRNKTWQVQHGWFRQILHDGL